MQKYVIWLCNLLVLAACSAVPAKSLLSSQPSAHLERASAFISTQTTSCPLRIDQNQKPLKLTGIHGVPTLAFSPDSRFLAIADDSGGSGVIIWDLATQKNHNILPSGWGGQLKFSPDGKRLAVGFRHGEILLANLANHTSIWLAGHKRGINAISFSPDGQHIATSSADNTARIWDLKGESLAVLPGVPRAKFGDGEDRYPSVREVSWGLSDQVLIIASGKVQIWQFSPRKLTTLKEKQTIVTDAVFSSDGKRVATGYRDGTSGLWSLFGHQLITLAKHGNSVSIIRFSPNGQTLLTASSDDKVPRLWNLSGEMFAILKGHEGDVTEAAFSPDGKCIFTSSMDNTIRTWDTSGREIARLPGSFAMRLSPDSRYLATSESDEAVLVWKLR